MNTEIVPGIHVAEHQVAEGKNAVILGRSRAVVVDTGFYPEEGQALAEFVHNLGYQPDRLILTHGHGDHILGSEVFREAEVFAHALTPVEMRRLLPRLAATAGETEEALASRIAWPTVTFSDELYIDLGDRHLRLFPTPGHSQDGISIFVEEERLLVAGDVVVTGIVPAIGDGDSRTLELSLAHLAGMPIEILIPGHGPTIQGAGAVRDWLDWLLDYLTGVRIFVQGALDGGVPPAAIPEMAEFDRFVGGRLPADRHKMPLRHQNTVAKIVAEEQEQRGRR